MTTHDRRYTIHQEYTGEPGPRYVARFCLAWISSHDTAEQARRACDLHHQARTSPVHTRPGARQMSPTDARRISCKRKMNQCIKLAREARRDSWQQPPAQRSEYRRISREALEDARYWRDEIHKLDNQEPPL